MSQEHWRPDRRDNSTMWELTDVIEPGQYELLAGEVFGWLTLFRDLRDAMSTVDFPGLPGDYYVGLNAVRNFITRANELFKRYERASRSVMDAARGGTDTHPTPKDIDTIDRRAWYIFVDHRQQPRRDSYSKTLYRNIDRMRGREVLGAFVDYDEDGRPVRQSFNGPPSEIEVQRAGKDAENYANVFLARLDGTARI